MCPFLNLLDGSISEQGNVYVKSVRWFYLELSFWCHLYKIQSRTWLLLCTYLFNKDIWNTLWSFMIEGNANLYAIGHILSRNSKGSQYLGAILAWLLKLQCTFPRFHYRKDKIYKSKFFLHFALIYTSFMPILCYLQIMPDSYNMLFHFFDQPWPKYNLIG